jgi:YihY family inner membrane protein
MHNLSRLTKWLNHYQQQNRLLGFSYAVIKKYGEDNAGYQAALLTYYGFLALFPLLLVLTTLTDVALGRYPHIEATVLRGITDYFPLLGNQLAAHIHSLKRSGFALFAGILFTLYGARGVASAFSNGVQHIWQIPKHEQRGFPQSLFKSLALLVVGGLGFLLASITAGLAAAAGHGFLFRGLSIVINLAILFWLFTFLINFSLPRHVTLAETRVGAACAAIGLVILQLLGGYILAHELKSLDALYSYFAISLGLLFWIYLQSKMLFYAVEIAIVNSQRLWPRSLESSQPTAVDKQMDRKRGPLN